MIDIHSHILPNLDDGPKSAEESLLMAENLERIGFKTIFATPHIYPGIYNNFREGILDSISIFRRLLLARKIEIDVRPGSEVFVTSNLTHAIDCNLILTLDDRKKFILLELPFFEYPAYIDQVIFSLLSRGVIPIISHPERNVKIQENISLARDLVERGVKLQLTIASFANAYGEEVRNVALSLLKEDLVHYLATDLHGNDGRFIEAGIDKLKVLIGQDRLKRLLAENAEEILGNGA